MERNLDATHDWENILDFVLREWVVFLWFQDAGIHCKESEVHVCKNYISEVNCVTYLHVVGKSWTDIALSESFDKW